MIKGIKTANIFVSDTERAYDFYVNTLGFEVRKDQHFGDYRWLELSPPGAHTTLAIAPAAPEQPELQAGGYSRIMFYTDDIQRTYRQLKNRGVNFLERPRKQAWGGRIAQFADPDGNVFVLGER